MALNDIVKTTSSIKDWDADSLKEHILDNIKDYRDLIAYWRVYPDRLIDYYLSLGNPYNFSLFYYQRVFLRCLFRHKYVFATFVRAWSKSFMSVMALMLMCILYPGAKIATAAGGKQQSAEILRDKCLEICKLIPAMEREIVWDTRGTRAQTRQTKDSVIYSFVNGSSLENVAANENTRGRRFQCLLGEECVGIDQDILNEVLIPTLNVSRLVNG